MFEFVCWGGGGRDVYACFLGGRGRVCVSLHNACSYLFFICLVDRQVAFHLKQLESLLLPTQTTKMSLWTLEQVCICALYTASYMHPSAFFHRRATESKQALSSLHPAHLSPPPYIIKFNYRTTPSSGTRRARPPFLPFSWARSTSPRLVGRAG